MILSFWRIFQCNQNWKFAKKKSSLIRRAISTPHIKCKQTFTIFFALCKLVDFLLIFYPKLVETWQICFQLWFPSNFSKFKYSEFFKDRHAFCSLFSPTIAFGPSFNAFSCSSIFKFHLRSTWCSAAGLSSNRSFLPGFFPLLSEVCNNLQQAFGFYCANAELQTRRRVFRAVRRFCLSFSPPPSVRCLAR